MFHVYWPVTACLTLIVVLGVIMALLKYGPRICKVRHYALPDEQIWREKTYEQPISYA